MKKKNKSIGITIVLVMILMISLSGCGRIKISGTYVNEHDKKEKFKFSGESKVTYYNKDGRIEGTYYGNRNGIVVTLGEGENETVAFLTVENKKVLYYDMMAFVKKGFIERNWYKFLFLGAAYSIVAAIYKRKTGRDLEEDLENLSDKL